MLCCRCRYTSGVAGGGVAGGGRERPLTASLAGVEHALHILWFAHSRVSLLVEFACPCVLKVYHSLLLSKVLCCTALLIVAFDCLAGDDVSQ